MPPQTPSCPLHRDDAKVAMLLGEIKGALNSHIKSVDQRFEDLNHALFGNGQPGVLDEMNKEIRVLQDWKLKNEEKHSHIKEEQLKSRRRTGMFHAVIVAVFSSSGGALMQLIFNYLKNPKH